MLRIRRTCSLTWFTRDGARVLASRLADRACRRFRKGGLMLTLTYDRSQYASGRDLYEAARDERHVRRFIHRLEKFLGAKLTGKWLRKMEFHEGPEGWLHWHLILDWRSSIPHAALTELWGHGHVWVGKATQGRVRYVCKYIAKTMEDLPGWLLGEPSRSVKVIAVSPGLWESGPPDPEEAGEGSVLRVRAAKLPGYVSIGQAMSKRREMIEVLHYDTRFGEIDVTTYRMRLNIAQVYLVLQAFGSSLNDDGDGWFSAALPEDHDAVLSELLAVEWASSSASGAAAADDEGLHSTTTPDAPFRWLIDFLEATGDITSHAPQSMRRAA